MRITGKMVRERRKALGLSQQETAEMLECTSQGALSQIETWDKRLSDDMAALAEKYLFSSYGKKLAFVTHELVALVKRIDPDIESLSYMRDPDGEEYVCIHYHQYEGEEVKMTRHVRVCVTADSLYGITAQVLKRT